MKSLLKSFSRIKLLFCTVVLSASLLSVAAMASTEPIGTIQGDQVCAYISVIPRYTITFNSNNEQDVNEAVSKLKDNNYTLPISTDFGFTRDGYSFIGWNTKADGLGDSYSFGATLMITSNMTLYAQWSQNTYTVTFDSKGGTAVQSQQFKMGDKITMPKPPTKTGDVFSGWYFDKDFTDKIVFSVFIAGSSDITLYAKWQFSND